MPYPVRPARRLSIALSALSLLLAGCSADDAGTSPADTVQSPIPASSAGRAAAVVRSELHVTCLDTSGSVPPAIVDAMVRRLAGEARDRASRPHPELHYIVRVMDGSSARSDSLVAAAKVPALPPMPSARPSTAKRNVIPRRTTPGSTEVAGMAEWRRMLADSQAVTDDFLARIVGVRLPADTRASDLTGCPAASIPQFRSRRWSEVHVDVVTDAWRVGPQSALAPGSLMGVEITIHTWCDAERATSCDKDRSRYLRALQAAGAQVSTVDAAFLTKGR